jgi:hypothetical protein
MGDETPRQIAKQRHLSPHKLCDWNRYELGTCEIDAKLPADFALKVPKDGCTHKPGVWSCYQVNAAEDLEAVAFGGRSFYRSKEKLIAYNKDILWGAETLFDGMHLRLPAPWCIPVSRFQCSNWPQYDG